MSQPTPQNLFWKQGAHRHDADEFQGPSPCQKDGKSPAPESTENSLEPGSCFLSKCCDINTIHYGQGFWAGSRCGCSPRESPGVNSAPWPPSPASLVRRSKCSWFSPAGMEGRVDFRNQVSSQPWTPGNQTPYHLPHLMPKSYRLGESGPMKSHPVSLKSHLGLSRMPGWVAQSNIFFPQALSPQVLKQTMSQPWHKPTVTDTCNPRVHMIDACVSHKPEDTWGHTPPGLQIFAGKGTRGW